jgi:4-amino-4-deoxy-L-arabinose transferase-like glycosyltransferase
VDSPRRDRLLRAGAWLLALGAFAVWVWSARDRVFVPPDAEQHGIVARSLLRGEGYTETIVPFHPDAYATVRHVPEFHGLLRPIVLVPLFAVLGVGPLALYIPSLAYLAGTALVVFAWGRRLVGAPAALLACALTLANLPLLHYALLATDDLGFTFFFTLALAVLHRALAEGRDRDYVLAGVAAGLAVLEKPSGFFIPAVLVLAVCRFGGPGLAARGRRLALVLAPFAAAASVYLLRNWFAYGSPQFRFGVLVWMYKMEGYEGWNRVFHGLPSLGAMLQTVGWERARDAIVLELGKFVTTTFPIATGGPVDALLPTLGLAGLVLCWRRLRILGWLFVSSLVASALFVCVMWHYQPRYLAFLVPLSALGLSGAIAAGAGQRTRGWWTPILRGASLLGAAYLVVTAALAVAAAPGRIRGFPDLTACRAGLAWLADNTAPTDRVLSFDPWSVAWVADREAIMIPTGGVEPIALVARRYDAHWLLAFATSLRPQTSRLVTTLDGNAADLRLTPRFADGGCRVLRVDWS